MPTKDASVKSAPTNATEDEMREWANMSTAEQLEIFQRPQGPSLSALEGLNFDDLLQEAEVAKSDVTVLNQDDKDQLIGKPFIIVSVKVNQGNFGPFVTLTCLGKGNEKFVINDGSTGIADQMADLVRRFGPEKPIYVPNGLRRSDYFVDNDTQAISKDPRPNSFKQSTYYLAI